MFFYIVLTPISTTSGLCSTGNTRKYQQIDVYIYQCEYCVLTKSESRQVKAVVAVSAVCSKVVILVFLIHCYCCSRM